MPKLILNAIVKDEAHCIESMLESAHSICDAIVIADTGSTDGTQDIIKKFGIDKNIPTFIFERPFDNFENSRNFGLEKAKEVIKELKWNTNDCWTWWCDADETVIIDKNFNKNQFVCDLYMMNTYIGNMKYTRNTFARASKPFRFYGPIHEFLICEDKNITHDFAKGIKVDVKFIGNSWKGNISEKYKKHAFVLEEYIDKDRRDPRWIFYTAQSYHDSACTENRAENEERLRRSIKYYKERVTRNDGYAEEIFFSQYRVASIMKMLEDTWSLTMQEFLKAYSIDPLRAEPIKAIIDHYLSVSEWNLAYLYSKFAKTNFHGKNPYPNRVLFVDEALYAWKIAEAHAAACFYTNRMDEAKSTFNEVLNIYKLRPELFNENDIIKLQQNTKFFNG